LRKYSKITWIFFLKSLEIADNRSKIWQFLVTSSFATSPPPSVINRHNLETPSPLGDDVICERTHFSILSDEKCLLMTDEKQKKYF
jgi:hypothetical protein